MSRRTRRAASNAAVRGPLALILVLIVIIMAAMVFDVPAGFWHQPGLTELRTGVLEAMGLPLPTATAPPPPPPTATAPPPATVSTPLPPASSTPPPPTSIPRATWYQVHFTTPTYPDTAADHVGGIDEDLVQLIAGAQHSIDVAAYELDLENIAAALLAAKQRGVTVRLVTDTDNLEEKAVQQLTQGGVPVVEDKRGAIMHNKFVIIDGHTVLTGSWNLTINCTYRNNNNAIIIESEALARNYQTEFAEMFEKQQFGPTSPRNTIQPQVTIDGTLVENYFAPEDKVSEKLVALLGKAQKSIRFMDFSFTDDNIGEAMLQRAKAGVSVAGVFERRGADTAHAEYPPMKQAGLDVLLDGNPYVMHHKVIIIDDSIVVTGSFNFTASADQSNDENVLIIHSASVAQQYLEEYERVRQRALEAKP
ncbi:MAG TPA: phospholipase D-like domain-containing protein [Anaerolineae bacterium]|nr:phospholipase D-like domain-containing protein [Anaerolineae bacterium]